MDTLSLLGQALECSVCLEQLDASSKVLPCQHTFCQKCLQDIITTQKELRCPECRVLVTVPFEMLPPNILLMRILEGIKKIPTDAQTPLCDLIELPSHSTQQTREVSMDPFSISSQHTPLIGSSRTPFNMTGPPLAQTVSKMNNPFLFPSMAVRLNGASQPLPASNGNVSPPTSLCSSTSLPLLVQPSGSNPLPIMSKGTLYPTPTSSFSPATDPFPHSPMPRLSTILNSSQPIYTSTHTQISLPNTLTWPSMSSNFTQTSIASTVTQTAMPSTITQMPLTHTDTTNATSLVPSIVPCGTVPTQWNYNQTAVPLSESQPPMLSSSQVEIHSVISTIHVDSQSVASLSLSESQPAISLTQIESQPLPSASQLGFQPLQSSNNLGPQPVTVTSQVSIPLLNCSTSQVEPQATAVHRAKLKESDSNFSSFISPPMGVPAKALFNYDGKEPRDLCFRKGDVLTVRKQIDENWYLATHEKHTGIVPASYVKLLDLPSLGTPQCRALYDFKMATMEDDLSCLTFSKGDSITVLRRVDAHWAEGHRDTHVGIFPLSFVELNPAAKVILGSEASSTRLTSCSRPTPPRLQGSLSLVTSTSLRSTGSSEASSSGPMQEDSSSKLHTTSLPNVDSPQLCTALYSYQPRKADELELHKGQLYSVVEKCQDGWCKGRCLASDKIGVFPGNYVQVADSQTASDVLAAARIKPSSNPASGGLTNIAANVRGLFRAPDLPPRALTATGCFFNPAVQRGPATSSPLPLPHQGSAKSEPGASLIQRKVTWNGRHRCKSPPIQLLSDPMLEDSGCSTLPADRNSTTAETSLPKTPVPLVRERYRCVVPYPANGDSELELMVGDIVYVHKRHPDGWLKGTLQRTGKTGLFPSIFVQAC